MIHRCSLGAALVIGSLFAAGCGGGGKKECAAVTAAVVAECHAFDLLHAGATTMSDDEFAYATKSLDDAVQQLSELDVPSGDSPIARYTRKRRDEGVALGKQLSPAYAALRKAKLADPANAPDRLSQKQQEGPAMFCGGALSCDSF